MDNIFLEKFLMITDIKTIIFILVLIGFFIFIKRIKKKANFAKRMIISIFIGIAVGVLIQFISGFPENPLDIKWLSEITNWYGLVGNGFMDLLKMIVVPLIFLSMIRVIVNINKVDNLKKLTATTLLILLGTTAISATVGIIVANIFKLGVGTEIVQGTSEMREITSLVDTLRGLLPANPVKAMAESNTVAIVIFSAFIGMAIQRLNKKHADVIKPFVDFVEAFYKIIVSVAITVIKFMPYAVIPLMANTIISRGVESILQVIDFIIALYFSVIIVFAIHLLMNYFNGIKPKEYLKEASKALMLAFTSRSSLGTLPVTIETLSDNIGVEEGIASFVGSLGSNMGMNGCVGIYPALMAVTLANIAGIETNITFYTMLIIIITISSLGIAGIPGTATIAVSVVISGMGMGSYFPLAGAILAIDPILDMGRTMLNVNGTMTTAIFVNRLMKK